jgi:hypothetical protein
VLAGLLARWAIRHEIALRARWTALLTHPRVAAFRVRFAPQLAFLLQVSKHGAAVGMNARLGRRHPRQWDQTFQIGQQAAVGCSRRSKPARPGNGTRVQAAKLNAVATAKPSVVIRPAAGPPCSKASGIMASASIVSTAPPAKD